ncbi:hypothetical protein BCR35DRAFT_350623 [Leucosporidium creatinivorum]|uniref:Arrestin-like N-terminal domain-containing protein n=1 Tax=Leucosporidium creatinivorum TaxID=106004 RepID=A0A1Y2G0F4_9BASI|nr:hypothetical protein BCR35DRAFT_350623 [Leucosporidium creatinivorum]
MLSSSIALLGSVALAAALPSPIDISPAVEIALLQQPTSSVRWECSVRCWVRAPDLTANLLGYGDARLLANGSACSDIDQWSVGLRLKERSIVRLAAEGVELPVKPEWNHTAHAAWQPRDDYNDIFRVGYSRFDEDKSPYDIEREAYERALRNKTLWEVHGAERLVFDSLVVLATAEEDSSIPLEAVKSFGIAVPNVNLPPTSRNGDFHWFPDRTRFAGSETQFDYYFSLRLRNGSSVEFPAGHAAFIPASEPLSLDVPKENVTIILERPTNDRSGWGIPSRGNCTADNSTTFSVEVEVPSGDHVFESGKELFLPTTIRRTKGTAQVPDYIYFRPSTAGAETWCSTFGHSEAERNEIAFGDPSFRRSHFEFGDGVMKLQMAEPVMTMQQEQEEADKEEGFATQTSCWSDGPGIRQAGGVELDHSVEVQTVLVNFTIPTGMMPTFKTTFKDYFTHLQVALITKQVCGDSAEAKLPFEVDEVHEDDLWLEYRRRSHSLLRKTEKLSLSHFGNLSITITSPLRSNGAPPVHYTHPTALSPLLLPTIPTAHHDDFPVLLNQEIRKEDGDQLKQRRYGWDDLRGMEPLLEDGRWQSVGQVWARKVQREKDLLKLKEEQEKASFVAQV